MGELKDDEGVRVTDLSKVYAVGASRVIALNRVDLTIPAGSFTAVVGTSGSGKSTLLNMLGGLEQPTAGEVFVAGNPLHTFDEDELVTFRRRNVGFIFQSFNLLPHLTAEENVALPLSFRGVTKDARLERARRVLHMLGLSSHAKHKPTQLSGGQQQRVGIARALVANPKIVFADEPTGNLDSRSGSQILAFLRASVRELGQTVIMVTHDAVAAAHASRVLLLADGKIAGEITDPTVEAVTTSLDALRMDEVA